MDYAKLETAALAQYVGIALLTAGLGTRIASASDVAATADWGGQYLGRRPHATRLTAKLGSFFGEATGALVRIDSPYLRDQFNRGFDIGIFDEYRLPDDQVIAVQSDARLGVTTVAVIDDPDLIAIVDPDNTHVLATAFLTNLCPKVGVNEKFVTSNGVHYSEHFQCELDYSLVVLYHRGSVPDPKINLDLINWSKASIATVHSWAVPDRQLLLKIFVRVLNDGPVDVNKPDNTLPVSVIAESM